MNYEDKYKQALERAREIHRNEDEKRFDMEWIFPELKESEDERTRKAIIQFFNLQDDNTTYSLVPKKDILAWLEKQGEQPSDKVEPKFKVRDWVILNSTVAQILDKQKYGFVGLDIDGKDFFCNYGHTDSMRLWTINDAKDGDVLLEEETGEPFIYNGNRAIYFSGYFLGAYCGIYNGEFNPYGNIHYWGKNSCPATKEQRELLFQKMKEAGYEWDAEKKELKKIEQDNHPRIVIRQDFNDGEGLYKINLDNLNEEQVDAIEMMIKNFKCR